MTFSMENNGIQQRVLSFGKDNVVRFEFQNYIAANYLQKP